MSAFNLMKVIYERYVNLNKIFPKINIFKQIADQTAKQT